MRLCESTFSARTGRSRVFRSTWKRQPTHWWLTNLKCHLVTTYPQELYALTANKHWNGSWYSNMVHIDTLHDTVFATNRTRSRLSTIPPDVCYTRPVCQRIAAPIWPQRHHPWKYFQIFHEHFSRLIPGGKGTTESQKRRRHPQTSAKHAPNDPSVCATTWSKLQGTPKLSTRCVTCVGACALDSLIKCGEVWILISNILACCTEMNPWVNPNFLGIPSCSWK